MDERTLLRQEVAHRAALMHDWKQSDSYRIHQIMVQELRDKAFRDMLAGQKDTFDYYKGKIEALDSVLHLPERVMHQHKLNAEADRG